MPDSNRLTIHDVARWAGVSVQTVSRVLNDRPDVSPETRRRIQQVIEELGYQPSALARSLIRQRSYTLGVVTAGLKYIGGPARALNGITLQADELGYTLLLNELPRFDSDAVQPLVQALLARQVDGVIWAVPEVGANRAWLASPGVLPIPFVFLSMVPVDGLSTASVDNYGGACLAVRHLLESGYRHIGHICGPLDWWEARQRRKGWEDTLAEAGLAHDAQQVVEGNWSSVSGAQAAEALFAACPDLDAVFAGNDQMALAALHVAACRGRRVPQDVGVVGFDGLPEAAYFNPPLTTVLQDQQALGAASVQEVVRLIEAQRKGLPIEAQAMILQPTLVVRQSTLKNES